ncbi:type II toxin-antitoxin system VapB family antitoxin [Azoarcus olearius]|uniref:Virulence-associated protein n=1 Tax=Azoarcus sp. (strain BH72) TaxID=418699 RepID=A1K2B4_AZOSB|nr:conserved hypothetical protein [Azoarcus olearius]
MERSFIFKSKHGQTVGLPPRVELPKSVKQVDIVALGQARLIVPSGGAWDSWFESEGVSDDFMDTREQPSGQYRGSFRTHQPYARYQDDVLGLAP